MSSNSQTSNIGRAYSKNCRRYFVDGKRLKNASLPTAPQLHLVHFSHCVADAALSPIVCIHEGDGQDPQSAQARKPLATPACYNNAWV